MELLVAIIIGVLVASGIYLCLRARTFPVVMGLTLLSYGGERLFVLHGRAENQ